MDKEKWIEIDYNYHTGYCIKEEKDKIEYYKDCYVLSGLDFNKDIWEITYPSLKLLRNEPPEDVRDIKDFLLILASKTSDWGSFKIVKNPQRGLSKIESGRKIQSTICEYLEFIEELEDYKDRPDILNAETLYELNWYNMSSVGFYTFFAPSLDLLVKEVLDFINN